MVHCFTREGVNFVIDVYSGSIHAVDELMLELINNYDKHHNFEFADERIEFYGRENYNAAKGELEGLIDSKLLFSDNVHGSFQLSIGEDRTIKAMCLHIAHDCNLRCRYCFASQGDFQGSRILMSKEVAKAAMDYMVRHSGRRKNLEIDLFGGEPLMNRPLIEYIVGYRAELEQLHNKNIRLTITTNGILLDGEFGDYINEHFYNVVLSLDGRPEVNDFMRPTISGGSSFDLIVPKYKKFVEKRLVSDREDRRSYYLRGTFTNKNLDFHKDVLYMADLGFDEISVEPVVLDKGDALALTEADLPHILNSYDELMLEMAKRNKQNKAFNFFHYNVDFEGGPCFIKKIRGCGAGSEYFAVTPEGDIYPCHRFVGDEKFRLGTVMDIEKLPLREDFFHNNVLNKPLCQKCWAKYYCSGGCHANQYNYNGNIKEPYALECEMQKRRIENAIYLKYMDAIEEER